MCTSGLGEGVGKPTMVTQQGVWCLSYEVTNGIQKNYCRSRTLVNVNRYDGLACITVEGTEAIIGR